MAGEEMMAPEQAPVVAPTEKPIEEASRAEKKLVSKWLKKIKAAEKHWNPVFERMKKCQQIATHGAYKEWLADETRYVAPILNRHINLAVSQLYAKNPQAVAEARRKLNHTVWDGTMEQPQILAAQSMMGDQVAQATLIAVSNDIAQAKNLETLAKRMAETSTILYQYQVDQQPFSFKTQIKALVRRTKVNCVGYVKLNFVREMESRPEPTAELEDSTAKVKALERLVEEAQENEDDCETEVAQMQAASLLQDFQDQPDRVVREQIIFDYPRSTEIILDPNTRHLKSLLGCGWLAQRYDLTEDQIKDTYALDIEEYLIEDIKSARNMMGEKADEAEQTYKVYEVQDKRLKQVFVICEGCEKYLRPPQEPDVYLERFFNIFPLVFNEIENDEEIYPLSDVWIARHMQFEYNRSREGLREHRIAARPYWLAARGRLGETDKANLAAHAAHAIVEVTPDGSDKPLSSVVEAGPTAAIDPNLYETESIHGDMQRAVGTQEANLGSTSGATATESSIAENSRMSSLSDNVDDLDEMLTELASASGQVLLRSMSKEMVIQIVGEGAVWPDAPVSRQQAADEITIKTRAGSSGRPNQAAELANLERAWPALSQIPGINPEPLGQKYANLLDIDYAELNRAGTLSIVAQNAMAKPMAAPPPGSDPAQQGGQGGANAERPPEQTPGPQPAFPAPGEAGLQGIA